MSAPRILYKYIGAEHALTVLQNLKLKLTPPIEFADPFEFLMRVERRIIRRQVEKIAGRNSFIKSAYELDCAKGLYSGDLKTYTRGFKANREKHIRDATRVTEPILSDHLKGQFLADLSKMYAVLCLTEKPDNILMWSHYASGHRGIVLGIEIPSSWKMHQVDYVNQRVAIDLAWNPTDQRCLDMVSALVKAKSEHWKYEQEWRAIARLDKLERALQGTITRYFTQIRPELIKEIVLGLRFPEEKIAEIITLHKKQFPQARLLKTSIHDNEYALIVRDLESPSSAPAIR